MEKKWKLRHYGGLHEGYCQDPYLHCLLTPVGNQISNSYPQGVYEQYSRDSTTLYGLSRFYSPSKDPRNPFDPKP